jgi:hypothetical protein
MLFRRKRHAQINREPAASAFVADVFIDVTGTSKESVKPATL